MNPSKSARVHDAVPKQSSMYLPKKIRNGSTIRIGSTPTFLYFDLYLHSAYAAHYVYIYEPRFHAKADIFKESNRPFSICELATKLRMAV